MLPSYPRSFGRLLVIGFVLVALPPLIGLVSNAISITRLADRSEHAVYQAVRVTQASRRLLDTIAALERNARQFLILPDPVLLDAYTRNHESLYAVAADFSGLDIEDQQRANLQRIMNGEAEVFAAMTDHALRPGDLRNSVHRFGDLNGLAQTMAAASDQRIDHEVELLRKTAVQAQQVMFWQLFALLPVIVFTAIGFGVLASRPIRDLDAAIRRLGAGQFSEPITVNEGPPDLRDLGRRLEWMRGQLIDIEREKNHFLREISHALKTPLTALREGSALLSEEVLGKLRPEQQEIAEILHRNSLELQRLIEELLDYDAAQFRRTVLNYTTVEIRKLAQQVLENHRPALQARRLVLDAHVPDIAVRADAEKIMAIMDNLLSNAIKYSPDAGRIILVVNRRDGHIVIDMIDQGPGISIEDRDRIYEPFYQGRASSSGGVKGSGVGLSIVREYAIAHGGNIELMDSDRGAHFRVTLVAEAIV
ncbi:MAG TPA: HAMP domain-containing sensor histidine kinase [Burkholderiales bacterium]|nr:HAMP domain-containing sensor histidine kinase [Burkholderiales bacterium]